MQINDVIEEIIKEKEIKFILDDDTNEGISKLIYMSTECVHTENECTSNEISLQSTTYAKISNTTYKNETGQLLIGFKSCKKMFKYLLNRDQLNNIRFS